MKSNIISKLIHFPNKNLLTPCLEIDFKKFNNNKLRSIYEEMLNEIKNIEGFYKGNCIGISANQIGYNIRMFVMSKYPKNDKLKNLHFDCIINPEILEFSTHKVLKWEGCVSDTEHLLLIQRPEIIKLRYFNLEGQSKIETLQIARSRIAQHEIDHLNGVDFYTHQIHNKIKIKDLQKDEFFMESWIIQENKNNYLI
jgi:peptide deformylase